MARPERVHDRIAAVSSELGGTVGVAARNLASQASVCVNADELFPMAGCAKIPVMVEVMRRVDAGALRLDDRLTLTAADKSPGGTLTHCREGLQPSVRDLLYLMITLNDDTATDMLWRRVGLDAVNITMRELDLATIDCFVPNREYSLMECGAGSDWADLNGAETVAKWRSLQTRDEKQNAFARVLEENARLSGAGFQHLHDQRWGRDGSCSHDEAVAIAQAIDNPGSPRDMAGLLAMVVESRCASAPSCRLMIEIMSRQERRERIPSGLPPGLLVANMSGGVPGTSNDAAIVYTPSGAPIVMAVYCKGLDHGSRQRAPRAIAGIATEVYAHLGEPS